MLHLQRAEAAELLDVYKGVVPYHKEMVDGMSIAPMLALEVRAEDSAVVAAPARHLRPQSLRARFGLDNANNGVHATDLEEDAELEVRYVFEMLAIQVRKPSEVTMRGVTTFHAAEDNDPVIPSRFCSGRMFGTRLDCLATWRKDAAVDLEVFYL
ncbi:Nucleoside diphosphate kinase 7 [Symbiodinium microadriaticum]|uniref:Nucleoside diphosphate kinase 7 n=1 Tax=Symbiodinium microadriaticum TaxID=2951 RepID=A0A1Q9F201_SYMMI|nr:Nucleoside diphosphate kinase 7 [Symbiodinium microadriaticum]